MRDAFYFPVFFIFSKKRGRRGSIFILFRLQNGDLILYPNDLGCSASKRKVKVSLQQWWLDPQYRKREEMEENRKRNRLSVNKFSYLTGPGRGIKRDFVLINWAMEQQNFIIRDTYENMTIFLFLTVKFKIKNIDAVN